MVVVNRDGFIDYLAPVTAPGSLEIIDRKGPDEILLRVPSGGFLLPTFCDLHLHAPQFLYQGTGLHLPLMEWLNEYAFKAEERIDTDPQLARNVYRKLAERLLEAGTGAVVLYGTISEEAK